LNIAAAAIDVVADGRSETRRRSAPGFNSRTLTPPIDPDEPHPIRGDQALRRPHLLPVRKTFDRRSHDQGWFGDLYADRSPMSETGLVVDRGADTLSAAQCRAPRPNPRRDAAARRSTTPRSRASSSPSSSAATHCSNGWVKIGKARGRSPGGEVSCKSCRGLPARRRHRGDDAGTEAAATYRAPGSVLGTRQTHR
jgi:hypothetical protein